MAKASLEKWGAKQKPNNVMNTDSAKAQFLRHATFGER
jgi:hypothetical protein